MGVNPILQTENAVVGEVITGIDGRRPAAERPQLRAAHAADAGRPDPRARQLHRGEPDGVVGPPLRQRPARAEQQLHARRRRPERGGRQPDRLLPEPGRDRRDPGRDQQLLGRVRQRGGRRRAARSRSRAPTSSTAARSSSRATTTSTPTPGRNNRSERRRRATSSSTSSAARSAARSSRTRCSSSSNYQGTRVNRPGEGAASVAPTEWRHGDFSSLLASGTVIRDPLTGQPFPGNQIPASRFSPQRPGAPRQHHELPAAQPAGAHAATT